MAVVETIGLVVLVFALIIWPIATYVVDGLKYTYYYLKYRGWRA